MSTRLEQPPAPQDTHPRGSLLRAEALRLCSRRMVQVLIALGLAGFLGGIALGVTQFATPTAAGLAEATQRRQQAAVEEEKFRADCLADVGSPNGPTEADCGPPRTPETLGPAEAFLAKPSFTLHGAGRIGVLGVAMATAVLAFLLGATYVGAEWSSRSMVALLFWEPRRIKVMAAKLGVLATALALLAVVAEGAWLLAARVLAATRGTTEGPTGLWAGLFASAGRGVLFVVLMGLLGFGLANLVRNTGGALGLGFVYFTVLESAIAALRPGWQEWLVVTNASALLTPGGLPIYVDSGVIDVVSNLQGGLFFAAVTSVVIAAGVVLFVRRDLD